MTKLSVLPPSGFRDFPPEEASARATLTERISQIYRSYGFQPIAISVLENLSTLQGKGGGADNERLIFKVLKRGEELERGFATGDTSNLSDLGLRFDLTLPLARYYARLREQLPKPFKVFHIGPVWRADRPQKGRFREFVQCDVDIIGSKEIGAEYDCIHAILDVFSLFGIKGVEVHLNNRALLAALGTSLNISEERWAEVLVALDKLDKIGPSGVMEELGGKEWITREQRKGMEEVLFSMGDQGEPQDSFWEKIDGKSLAGIRELQALLQANLHDDAQIKIRFNPTLVRGQDYYTGTIFEVRHPDLTGSLAGGGRYNRLLEIFGTAETPAFGGSIGFERLFMLLTEQEKLRAYSEAPQVFFPLFHNDLRVPIYKIAQDLRMRNLRVDVFPDAVKLKNQLKYADDRKIPFVALIGEEEWEKKIVKLKNMKTRAEEEIPLDAFAKIMENLCL